jgi:sugar fermentation stimulation protein A
VWFGCLFSCKNVVGPPPVAEFLKPSVPDPDRENLHPDPLMAPPISPLLIEFPNDSFVAVFLRREKRFLIEAERDGRRFWAHCNNSGSMLGLLRRGSDVLLSVSPNKSRRLPFTLELIKHDDHWVGVNTLVPNRLLRAAWDRGVLPEVAGCNRFISEQTSGLSRLDAVLDGPEGPVWIEAKNVTLVEDDVACFPDAVTTRGQKHLGELTALACTGQRAACFYLVQRSDASCFAPADFIDQDYARLFWKAVEAGVEIWPYEAVVTTLGIGLGRKLQVLRPARG